MNQTFFAHSCSVVTESFVEKTVFNSTELLLCLCWKSVGHICVHLYLTSLICSIAVLIYLYANISLSWSQYLYSKSWDQVVLVQNWTHSLLTYSYTFILYLNDGGIHSCQSIRLDFFLHACIWSITSTSFHLYCGYSQPLSSFH